MILTYPDSGIGNDTDGDTDYPFGERKIKMTRKTLSILPALTMAVCLISTAINADAAEKATQESTEFSSDKES